ncbi:MAG: cation diffusion facilitator family transporter [Kiritimatiellia bacterium]
MSSSGAVRLVLMGVIGNTLLAAVKLIAGIVGTSYALIADAVESMVDVVGSVVVLGGLRLASREADEVFPYGYGKAEALSAFVVGLIILFAAVGIVLQAVREILTPHHAPAPFTLIVLFGVVLVKETLSRLVSRANRGDMSVALSADSFHHRADAITSGAAAMGIAIALWGGAGWESADDWAALVASAIIFYNGMAIIRRATTQLLDRRPSEQVLEQVKSAALAVAGVLDVEKLWVRQSGTVYFVDIHVHADPAMSLLVSHDVSHAVKSAISERVSGVKNVLVHMEPART